MTSNPTIALFGQFGIGNLGNDGSLEAMVLAIRRHYPDAKIVALCSAPDALDPGLNVSAVRWSRGELRNPLLRWLNGMAFRMPYKLLGPIRAFRILRRFDALIIPGTGILDDFGERPRGVPFVIFKWAVAARLARCRLAMVSIGAGPIHRRLSRFFMLTAARCAHFLTVRDEPSREFIQRHHLSVAADAVLPDLAFGLPLPEGASRQRENAPVLGLGVMRYRGWTNDDGGIYQAYVGKLARFAIAMLQQGYRIRLVIGEDADEDAVEAVRSAITEQGGAGLLASVEYAPARSLGDVMDQMATVDVAVATRFHNVVCALMAGTPVISLSYGSKNDVLLQDMGLGAFTSHAERFDLGWLEDRVKTLLAEREEHALRIAERVAAYRDRLAMQENRLFSALRFSGAAG
jgi:polysaccharide pyruvyl transferase WcaK-like protein